MVLGLKSVIWSLWTLCAGTPKVRCAEIWSSVFQYGLGQCLFMTEKSFEIRQFFLVKNVKLYILCFALCEYVLLLTEKSLNIVFVHYS